MHGRYGFIKIPEEHEPHYLPQGEHNDFFLVYERLCEAANVHTTQELADFFHVQLFRVNECKRRNNIPVIWLYHLLLTKRISPRWILYKLDPKIMKKLDIIDDLLSSLLLRQAAE